MNPEAIGRAVRARRRQQGLPQFELAALAGVGNRFLSDLENGKASVELGKVIDVLVALGLELKVAPRDWPDLA